VKPLTAFAVFMVAACSSAPAPEPERMPAREEMRTQHTLARYALEARQYDQAIALYEQALVTAYARDDARVIGEIGYELAIVRLRRGEFRQAEKQIDDTIGELQRRRMAPFPELRLVQALALYSGDQPARARPLAAAVIETPGTTPATIARAWHLLGMIAADQGNVTGVSTALAAIVERPEPALAADRTELEARRRALEGAHLEAVAGFERTATLRRERGDYTGIARALGFAAESATKAGQRGEAANFYLRAARSAAADGQRDKARGWLEAAHRAASASGQAELAREASAAMEELR
jgi:hypothetical protein